MAWATAAEMMWTLLLSAMDAAVNFVQAGVVPACASGLHWGSCARDRNVGKPPVQWNLKHIILIGLHWLHMNAVPSVLVHWLRSSYLSLTSDDMSALCRYAAGEEELGKWTVTLTLVQASMGSFGIPYTSEEVFTRWYLKLCFQYKWIWFFSCLQLFTNPEILFLSWKTSSWAESLSVLFISSSVLCISSFTGLICCPSTSVS